MYDPQLGLKYRGRFTSPIDKKIKLTPKFDFAADAADFVIELSYALEVPFEKFHVLRSSEQGEKPWCVVGVGWFARGKKLLNDVPSSIRRGFGARMKWIEGES